MAIGCQADAVPISTRNGYNTTPLTHITLAFPVTTRCHHSAAARRYVEADRSRADEYYLGADNAVAEYATLDRAGEVTAIRSLTADEYERWVDWTEPITGESMGTPRAAAEGTKGSPLFAEMTINAPKSLSVAAALHPEVSDALDAAQQDALAEIRRWLGQHSVTRVGRCCCKVRATGRPA